MDPPDTHRDTDAPPEVEGFDRLLESVYAEMRRIAHFHRLNERRDLTLQTTALVHEAYLRLVNSQTIPAPRDERHMRALTSRVIKRVLVDHARQRNAQKRDNGRLNDPLLEADLIDPRLSVDILDLDAALNRLAKDSARLARVVELRFFGGLTNEEVGEELGLSTRTAERDWQKARIYLLDLLLQPDPPG